MREGVWKRRERTAAVAAASRNGSERGAVLIHIAVSLLVLTALSAWVADYGILWVSRAQIQTSADAAALAAAIHLNNGDPDDYAGARTHAILVGHTNGVWAEQPDIQAGDVHVPIPCPPGTGAPDICVKVDAYRNQARSNALPTLFGHLLGVQSQGVRATATAQVAPANGTTCLKPWMVPDKFDDVNGNGSYDAGDSYAMPGYTAADDYGVRLLLKAGDPKDAAAPGFFYPISEPDTSASGDEYRHQIASCEIDGWIGRVMESNPGNMKGPTNQGMQDLINRDPSATYNEETGTVDSPYGLSTPRIVPVALYSPVEWASRERSSGRFDITIVNIMMFFVEHTAPGEVEGVIIKSPGTIFPTVPGFPSAGGGFLNIVRLVR